MEEDDFDWEQYYTDPAPENDEPDDAWFYNQLKNDREQAHIHNAIVEDDQWLQEDLERLEEEDDSLD